MIYVTGDLHGDLSRFKAKEFRKLKKGDTLIVCGDFGFIWNGDSKETRILKKLGKKKYNILFVEGTNDNFNLVEKYPIADWNGGKVRAISGRLMHLCRGSIFTIEGYSIFTFGGGEANRSQSDGHISDWYTKTLPSLEEISTANSNLKKVNFKVDYIITHQSSHKIKKLLSLEDDEVSRLDIFLDEVRNKAEYIGWYFGSYHKDKIIPPNEMAVFEKVMPLNGHFELNYINLKKELKKFENVVDF